MLCITHEIDRLASADNDFVGMCVHQTWIVLVATTYRRRHRHQFCRCVYACPKLTAIEPSDATSQE